MGIFNFRFRGEPRSLDENSRTAAPGDFFQLSDGFVHYQLDGPEDGPPVVLIHGFSVPYYIWDPIFPDLVSAGLRVLRYDLYGRGYSDRPDVDYDENLFDRQLVQLLAALEMKTPVNLVGLSMGGPIAVVVTNRHPELVNKLCLMDPAGFSTIPRSMKWLRLPIVGELLMSFLGDKMLLSSLTGDFYQPQQFQGYVEMFRDQMQYQGFKRALLSTLRGRLLWDMESEFRQAGRVERPALLVWGREDHLTLFSTNQRVREAIPYLQFHPIDDADHLPHYERPDLVTPLLIDFLRE